MAPHPSTWASPPPRGRQTHHPHVRCRDQLFAAASEREAVAAVIGLVGTSCRPPECSRRRRRRRRPRRPSTDPRTPPRGRLRLHVDAKHITPTFGAETSCPPPPASVRPSPPSSASSALVAGRQSARGAAVGVAAPAAHRPPRPPHVHRLALQASRRTPGASAGSQTKNRNSRSLVLTRPVLCHAAKVLPHHASSERQCVLQLPAGPFTCTLSLRFPPDSLVR